MRESQERNLEEMKREFEERQMSERQIQDLKSTIEQAKKDRRKAKRLGRMRATGAVAAAVAVFVILPNTSAQVAHAMSSIPVIGKLVDVVTFRDYKYNDERNEANVEVPELIVDKTEATVEKDEEAKQKLEKTTEEINAEIKEISDRFITEFEENLKYKEGYQDILVKSEVINTTEDYFTLKLICYQGAGSGMEWNYFYTIDLETGERLALKDLFVEGADYITPISEDIKKQMRQQMAQDENIYYWVDQQDVPDWNFKAITDETSFYVNADGNVVIVFNEGDVAPMYMGVVEFIIPADVLQNIFL